MGRLHADLYPLQSRTPLAEVDTFRRFLGGFAGNVGVGLARLGVATAVISGVGDDGHGEFIRAALLAEGIDTQAVQIVDGLRTAITFCELWPPDRFPLTAYRLPTCPDWELRPEELPSERVGAASILFVSGTGLAQEPSRSATRAALRCRRGTSETLIATVLDLDWRPGYWQHPEEYGPQIEQALELADTVIGSDSEFAAAGIRPTQLLNDAVRRIFIKHGPEGATLLDASGSFQVPPTPIEVVNGLGAGDAFAAAVGWGLLRGYSPLDILRRADLAGAIVAGRLACAAAMPSADELLHPLLPFRPDPSLRGRDGGA